MGTMQHDVLIATTWDEVRFEKAKTHLTKLIEKFEAKGVKLKKIKEQIKEIEHTWIYNDIAVGFEGENEDGNMEFTPDNEMTERFSKNMAALVKLAEKL